MVGVGLGQQRYPGGRGRAADAGPRCLTVSLASCLRGLSCSASVFACCWAGGLSRPAPDARGHVFNPETPGLRLNRAEQIPQDGAPASRPQLAPCAITDFNTCMGALYTVALENLNPVQPGDWQRTIGIDFLNFSPKIKRISDAQKQSLLDSGRKGAQAFFSRKNCRNAKAVVHQVDNGFNYQPANGPVLKRFGTP